MTRKCRRGGRPTTGVYLDDTARAAIAEARRAGLWLLFEREPRALYGPTKWRVYETRTSPFIASFLPRTGFWTTGRDSGERPDWSDFLQLVVRLDDGTRTPDRRGPGTASPAVYYHLGGAAPVAGAG
jgi:hypothetical protein